MSLLVENQLSLPQFADTVQEYCLFIESFSDGRPAGMYTTLELLLARIHSGVLPIIAQVNDKENLKLECCGELTHEQWLEMATLIQDVTADDRSELVGRQLELSYGEYDDDVSRADTLWDDLADIYRDLQHGLIQWNIQSVESKVAASWQWRFNFEAHWGSHLARATLTVHEMRYQLYRD